MTKRSIPFSLAVRERTSLGHLHRLHDLLDTGTAARGAQKFPFRWHLVALDTHTGHEEGAGGRRPPHLRVSDLPGQRPGWVSSFQSDIGAPHQCRGGGETA